MKAKIISEAMSDVFKPLSQESQQSIKKLMHMLSKYDNDPYQLINALLDSGADPKIFAQIFVKNASKEDLEEYILDTIDPYGDSEQIEDMFEYLSINQELEDVLTQYARNENNKEFETMIDDAYNKLGKEFEDALKKL